MNDKMDINLQNEKGPKRLNLFFLTGSIPVKTMFPLNIETNISNHIQ